MVRAKPVTIIMLNTGERAEAYPLRASKSSNQNRRVIGYERVIGGNFVGLDECRPVSWGPCNRGPSKTPRMKEVKYFTTAEQVEWLKKNGGSPALRRAVETHIEEKEYIGEFVEGRQARKYPNAVRLKPATSEALGESKSAKIRWVIDRMMKKNP